MLPRSICRGLSSIDMYPLRNSRHSNTSMVMYNIRLYFMTGDEMRYESPALDRQQRCWQSMACVSRQRAPSALFFFSG